MKKFFEDSEVIDIVFNEQTMQGNPAIGSSSKEYSKGAGAAQIQQVQIEYVAGKFKVYNNATKKWEAKNIDPQTRIRLESALKKDAGLSLNDIEKEKLPPVDFVIHSNGRIDVKQRQPE